MTSVYLESEYVMVSCGNGCAQRFAMGRGFYDDTKCTGATWYCPSGHPRVWKGATTEQELRSALARASHLGDQLRASEAAGEAVRLWLVRDRQRFANGVCPCCSRSFEDVARHVRTKHPDYDPADIRGPSTGLGFACSCHRAFKSLQGLRVHQRRSRPADWDDPAKSRWERHLTVVGA